MQDHTPHMGSMQNITPEPAGRMFVIEVVPIQCSKLFKGMECAVMSMAL